MCDISRGHASKSSLSCKASNGNPEPLLDYLLNDFNIRIYNFRTRASQIIIKVTCPLESFKQSLYCVPFQSFCDIKLHMKTLRCFKDTVVQIVKFQDKKSAVPRSAVLTKKNIFAQQLAISEKHTIAEGRQCTE